MKKIYCLFVLLLTVCMISSCRLFPGSKFPWEESGSRDTAESTSAITAPLQTIRPPVTTKAPETTKAPVTTKAPETTKAQTTAPEPPSEYADHVYLIAKGSGYCAELVGTTYVHVFLVDDGASSWDSASTAKLKDSFAQQEQKLESEIKSYGKTLDIIYKYTPVSISATVDTSTSNTDWQNEACSKLGLINAASAQKLLQDKNGGSSNPIVFVINKAGRAYAAWNKGNASERVTLFSSSLDSLRHELCHLYGARDFYYPTEAKKLADQHIPTSLMCSGDEVDALTAYLIGWDEELDANAKAFLEATKHFTKDYLDEENSVQTTTGNVTNHKLSYGVYTGYLSFGVPNGKGKVVFDATGDIYEGDFENGHFHGKGKYTWTDGNYYDGDWANGERTGKGTFIWASGARYVGDFVNGECMGKGKYTWPSGDVYEGDYVDGKRTGKGKYTWASGAYYEGDFIEGKRTGKGKQVWTSGNVYEGDFVNGAQTGQGTYTYKSGDVYTGGFLDNKFSGEGTYRYSAGHVYTGTWANGARNGYGKMTWADGSSYVGDWKGNRRHGYGKYINKSGKVFEGQWNNDVFQG